MGFLGLITKGVHMANNILPPGDVAHATASELAPKGRNFWQKLNIGMGRVEDFVRNVKGSPIKVQTQSSIDKGTLNQLLFVGLAIVFFVFISKKR